MTEKKFASQADLEEKKISWEKLSDNAYAYTAEGDPNTGVIIGDDGCMIIDATATPVAAQGVIAKIREITDKPIKYVVLTHYHAVRVLGASGYKSEGLEQIIASRDTYDLIVERGQQDMDSEIGRFPRLFQAVESVPGLTWPTITFEGEMTLWLGKPPASVHRAFWLRRSELLRGAFTKEGAGGAGGAGARARGLSLAATRATFLGRAGLSRCVDRGCRWPRRGRASHRKAGSARR